MTKPSKRHASAPSAHAHLVGYVRVSAIGQSLQMQVDLLRAAGCTKIFTETRNCVTAADRVELQHALGDLRQGDVLVVTRLDRIARSIVDLRRLVARLEEKGVGFRVLQQDAIDTTRPDGRSLLNLLASLAVLENDMRCERRHDRLETARATGNGRRSLPVDEVKAMTAAGKRPVEIALALGISRMSVYRALNRREQKS